MTQPIEIKQLPTLDESQARRQEPVTTGGQDATVPTLLPGELEEVEQRARRGETIRARSALGMVGTIYSLTWRVSTRFRQAAEANDRAEHWRDVAQEAKDQYADAQAQIKKLEEDLRSRYTAVQVGDFQASEAELVAVPLQRRVETLENFLGQARSESDQKDQVIEDLKREVSAKGGLLRAAMDMLRQVFNLVNSAASTDAIKVVEGGTSDQAHHLARVIRDVRWMLASYAGGTQEAATEMIPVTVEYSDGGGSTVKQG